MANGYTVSWQGKCWQLPGEAIGAGLRGCKVRVEGRADGSVHILAGERLVEAEGVERADKNAKRAGKSEWMRYFSVKNCNKRPAPVPAIRVPPRGPGRD